MFKVASGDNTFFPLIETLAGFLKPLIISTGLADLPLLRRLHADVNSIWARRHASPGLAFLHCVTSYPVPPEQANLGAIATLRECFPDCTIGYSDHTLGLQAATYAVAAGARIIASNTNGMIEVGGPAELVLVSARDVYELNCRPQSDRVVIVSGVAIDRTLPDYRELDSLRV